MLASYVWTHPITVRFRDLDAFGHVNHAVYFTYLEEARLSYFARALDIPNLGLGDINVVVVDVYGHYLSPAYLGDVLHIALRPHWMRTSSFGLEYRITTGIDARLIAEATTTLAAYDHGRKRLIPIAPVVRQAMERLQGSPIPVHPLAETPK